MNFFWDPEEPKLLIVEAKSAHDINDDSFTPRRKYSTIYSSLTKAPVGEKKILKLKDWNFIFAKIQGLKLPFLIPLTKLRECL